MRYFFEGPSSVSTDVSSSLYLFVPLIANEKIQVFTRDHKTRRNHPQVEPLLKKIHYLQTRGTGVIYLFTSSELRKCRFQSLTKTIILLNFYEAFSTLRIPNMKRCLVFFLSLLLSSISFEPVVALSW